MDQWINGWRGPPTGEQTLELELKTFVRDFGFCFISFVLLVLLMSGGAIRLWHSVLLCLGFGVYMLAIYVPIWRTERADRLNAAMLQAQQSRNAQFEESMNGLNAGLMGGAAVAPGDANAGLDAGLLPAGVPSDEGVSSEFDIGADATATDMRLAGRCKKLKEYVAPADGITD